MGSYDVLELEACLDTPHEVHEDMMRRTVGCISCGVNIIQGKVSKQKLDKKITTESEVVAVRKYVPYKIYTINIFLGK